MSEGFHRSFGAGAPTLGCALVPLVFREGRGRLWARPASGEAAVLPHHDDGMYALAREVLAGEPAVARAGELARRLGFDIDSHALYPAGRWVTTPSAPVRSALELFVLEAEGDSHPGGVWLDAREMGEEHARGTVYPGPMLGTLAPVVAGAGSAADVAERLRALLPLPGAEAQVLPARPDVLVLPAHTPTLPPATHTNTVAFMGPQTIVVDPASPYVEAQDTLAAWLDAALTRGNAPARIVLTHHHRDHVGGAEALRKHFDVPIVAHPETARLLNGIVDVDEFVEEGDVLSWAPGRRVRVLHTPGHAPGHIVLFDEDTRLLVAGDMVAGQGTIIVEPTEGDMSVYLEQLSRLAALDATLAIPAHGPLITSPARRFADYIAHRRWREERVLAVLEREGPADARRLTPLVYEDVPRIAHGLAERQLTAHLIKLERDGRVRSEGRRWGVIR